MRVKKDKLKIFLFKRGIVVEKNEFKKKGIKKIKGQTKRKWKRRWMRNVMNKNKKWWKKDGRKTCKKEKHKTCFVSREIHFKNTEEFFF